MDANRYATKKTIAQGMLDIALLTANASQLKYILQVSGSIHFKCLMITRFQFICDFSFIFQVGNKHEFYTLMLTLISISIIMQVRI